MCRGLLIVICSVLLASAAQAQIAANVFSWGVEGNRWITLDSSTGPGAKAAGVAAGDGWYWESFHFRRVADMQGKAPGVYEAEMLWSNLQQPYLAKRYFTFNGSDSLVMEPPGWEPPPADEAKEFEWTFGPEWAGAVVQIKDGQGIVLATWGLPASIGAAGYVLSSSVTAPSLEGAQVFIDGVSVADLAVGALASGPQGFDVDRPGYGFSFDGTYGDGDWQLRRSDGSVAASGTVATLGTALEGRITIGGDESAEVYTRVPGGDGIGSSWVPSGVVVRGSGVTYYSFVNNPNPPDAPPPPALPSPTPAPTASPAPAQPTSGTNSITPGGTPEADVVVDVAEIEAPSLDSGEHNVLGRVDSAAEKIRLLLEKTEQIFSNVALTYGEFSKLAFGGVGHNCELSFGPVTIELGGLVPTWLRNGMKLIVLLTFAVGAYRVMMWTFS